MSFEASDLWSTLASSAADMYNDKQGNSQTLHAMRNPRPFITFQ